MTGFPLPSPAASTSFARDGQVLSNRFYVRPRIPEMLWAVKSLSRSDFSRTNELSRNPFRLDFSQTYSKTTRRGTNHESVSFVVESLSVAEVLASALTSP
jgi:hypothetical protein